MLYDLLKSDPPVRLRGTAAVFGARDSVPLALVHHLKHNHVMHDRVLLVSTATTDTPHVGEDGRAVVTEMEFGLTRVLLQFGFVEQPNVPAALFQACRNPALRDVDPADVTYYLRRETLIVSRAPKAMARWRRKLFAAMLLNANRSASYYGLPLAQVVEIGIELEI